MNADASQAPLSLTWFFGLIAFCLLAIAVTLLAERRAKRRRRARAAYRAHCDLVLRGERR